MSLILHLSDLHLAPAGTYDEVGDYKVRAIPEPQRQTRVKLLRQTLDALRKYLNVRGEVLDCVVITGDVTTRSNPVGFAALPSILGRLGNALPPANRIVVLPGNHDVVWGTKPSTIERYRPFIDGVRRAGYVTPLLDGIDYREGRPRAQAKPLVVGQDYMIVAMNTSDMCGVREPIKKAAEQRLTRLTATGDIDRELAEEIERLRVYDMPRVSQTHWRLWRLLWRRHRTKTSTL